MEVMSKLAKYVGPLLGFYLAFKIGDLVIRQTYIYLSEFSIESVLWLVEVLFGVIIPLRMFFWDKVLKSKPLLLTASSLVIFGVFLNRFNVFIISYTPVYSSGRYWPSIGEVSVTLGFIALEILIYRAFVMIFPVISQPYNKLKPITKLRLRGVIR
jgi:Ni/Fe-hydrogenase subunit HybB-like protein